MISDLQAANRAARAEILGRVRDGLGRPEGAVASERPELNLNPLPAPRMAPFADLKTRFIHCAKLSSATVDEVNHLSDVPAAVQRYLAEYQLPKRAAIWASLAALDWAASGIAVDVRAANGDDAVGVTGVFCAIAETGTLVVHSGPDTAATTSLLPETHIAIVATSRIVAGMEEAFALLKTERGELPRSVNLISGPSRTGDIEQTIVLGAHGPYRVHLILVDA